MCDTALLNIAPEETKKASKFNVQWGSVLDYMDLSIPEPLALLSCAISDNPYQEPEPKVKRESPDRQLVKVKSKYGQLYKALELHERSLNRNAYRCPIHLS